MCVCVCACVLDREGNEVFASRAPAVVSMEGSVSDRLQRLSDRFPRATFVILQMSHRFEKCLARSLYKQYQDTQKVQTNCDVNRTMQNMCRFSDFQWKHVSPATDKHITHSTVKTAY